MVTDVTGDGRAATVSRAARELGSRQEAEWIVEHVEGAGGGQDEVDCLVARRAAGEPLQYVLGTWPFRTLELAVDPRVLIPRPETEQVVEVALAEVGRRAAPVGWAVDLGTGSGAVALSLAVELAPAHSPPVVIGVDRSADAIAVADENRRRLALRDRPAAERVQLVTGSWFDPLPAGLAGRVDLVVANPPYVSEAEYPGLEPVVRCWEPAAALVGADGAGGEGGLADIEHIVVGAPRWLATGGVLVVEHAPGQAAAVAARAEAAGFASWRTAPDLSGRPRMLVAVR